MKMIGIFVAIIVLFIGIVVVRAMRTGGKAPSSGTPAPDFTLNSQDGKALRLHDLRGKWVVLYFYPKDFTSGCTKEAHNFQRDLRQYEEKNAIILGVSVQDETTHQKFCAKEGLGFRLLADTNHQVSSSYDSLMNLDSSLRRISSCNARMMVSESATVSGFILPGNHRSPRYAITYDAVYKILQVRRCRILEGGHPIGESWKLPVR
ncbi:MAG: hypothetical protein DMG53_00890 [Acidobacteria bacterium]|nr:MAG: hypothetical protein DMG53_00890 [Acidobacteriota bacterium]